MQPSRSLPESRIPENRDRDPIRINTRLVSQIADVRTGNMGPARATRKSICSSARQSVKLRCRSLIRACKLRRSTGLEVIHCCLSSQYVVQGGGLVYPESGGAGTWRTELGIN